MPKNIEDIILPERRRSIRDVPIPERRKRDDNFETPQIVTKTPPIPRKNLWLATGTAILVLVFVILSIFDSATLAYIPKFSAVSFDHDIYTARKTGAEGLLYSVVKLSGDKGLEAKASGEEKIERKASGTIIIYNASRVAQKLRATTRFETPDGKIYQIKDTITIPGKSVTGGVEKLGTLEVRIYAERPGEAFNIGLTDFTLPGLKGTSLFTSVYARSKTEMSGGLVGVEKIVSDQDKVLIKTQLEKALIDELTSEVEAQVPEDFILLAPLSSVTFDDLPQTESRSKDSVMVNMRANFSGVMFKRSDLSKHLALDKIGLAAGESVDVSGFDSLSFAFADTLSADLFLSNEIKFSITGKAIVVWRTDEVALKADLIGKHKKDIPSILNNYPTVHSATITIRPFWKNSFPSESAHISIKKLPAK